MSALRDGRWRRDLLVGVAVVLPVALVGAIVYTTASTVFGLAARIVALGESLGLRGTVAAVALLGAAAIAVPLALVGVGVAVRHRFGHRIVATVDSAFESLPAVGPIYGGLRRSRDAIGGGEAFREVVRVELADGVHAMAFLVDRPDGTAPAANGAGDADSTRPDRSAAEALEADGDDLVTVYLPFAPNPAVGGHLLGVREGRLEPTDLSVPEAIGILVGFGPHKDGPRTDHPQGSFYHLRARGESAEPTVDDATAN